MVSEGQQGGGRTYRFRNGDDPLDVLLNDGEIADSYGRAKSVRDGVGYEIFYASTRGDPSSAIVCSGGFCSVELSQLARRNEREKN